MQRLSTRLQFAAAFLHTRTFPETQCVARSQTRCRAFVHSSQPTSCGVSATRTCRHRSYRHCRRRDRSCTQCYTSANGQQGAAGLDGAGQPQSSRRLSELFSQVVNLPWERAMSWAIVVLLAMQLKDFFGIIMGTFVLSFIGNNFVTSAQQWPIFSWFTSRSKRRLLVLIYFSALISLITLFGVMTIPDIVREGSDFVERLQNDNIWVVVLKKMRSGLGDGMVNPLERFLLLASSDDIVHMAAEVQSNTPEHTALAGMALQKLLRRYTEAAVAFTSILLTASTKFAMQAGVSLVLSFMLVWDLPAIARGVKSLQTSRVAAIYNEVAPSLVVFGQLFGKALGAQTQIAAVNTALTAAGMWMLQIPGMAILSLFVFLCGFIPIAGCFISTVPIGFVALTEYGFMKLALVIAMVVFVHFIEAYGLNPAIYSAHLKLHPLLVLTVLVVSEHSLGIWGLLLAVPLTVFTVDLLRSPAACSITDVAARELKTVTSSKEFDTSGVWDPERERGPGGRGEVTLGQPLKTGA